MSSACIKAIHRGNMAELKTLLEKGHPLHASLAVAALTNCRYDIFDWLKEQGCETLGVEVRYYENGITGAGFGHTLDKNERRFGLRS